MNKSPTLPVRATFAVPTALPGGGAYDTAGTATVIACPRAESAELLIQYTRGAAGGAFKVKVLVSDDGVNFFERTVIDGSSLSSGAMNVYTEEEKFPVAAAGAAELRTLVVNLRTCIAFKVLFAEYGVTATPGTLSATCMMAG